MLSRDLFLCFGNGTLTASVLLLKHNFGVLGTSKGLGNDMALSDHVDSLRASRRYWRDPEFRANVNELLRYSRDPNRVQSRLIVEEVLTLNEQLEQLSAEFILLNKER